jgi:hypothetical protein
MTLPELPTALEVGLRVLWLLVFLFLAVAAGLRFRTTASGVLLTGAFAVGAILLVVNTLLHFVVLKDVPYDSRLRVVTFILTSVGGLVVNLVLAVGIALIPASLKRLGHDS